MKKYTLKLSPYPTSLKLELLDELPEKDTFGLTSLDDDGVVLVQIYNEVPDEELLNICIHEAVHVVQFIEELISGSLDQETAAYMTAYTACWMLSKVQKKKKNLVI